MMYLPSQLLYDIDFSFLGFNRRMEAFIRDYWRCLYGGTPIVDWAYMIADKPYAEQMLNDYLAHFKTHLTLLAKWDGIS